MSMSEQDARAFVGNNHRGVLATIKRDGRPQLTNIVYAMDHDGKIQISTAARRSKAINLRRDPRASLVVEGDNWGQYVVVEGSVIVRDTGIAQELRRLYEQIAGQPHSDWDEFDRAMVTEGRVLLEMVVERLYPLA
ncbi:MAG: PPOX class F420-dependent oxidoreductase [Chloroflexi bacterium]|nr:PPOX class F420-dependent oxidoreductase [Chloroflexota bacterium]